MVPSPDLPISTPVASVLHSFPFQTPVESSHCCDWYPGLRNSHSLLNLCFSSVSDNDRGAAIRKHSRPPRGVCVTSRWSCAFVTFWQLVPPRCLAPALRLKQVTSKQLHPCHGHPPTTHLTGDLIQTQSDICEMPQIPTDREGERSRDDLVCFHSLKLLSSLWNVSLWETHFETCCCFFDSLWL